jgi:cytochrome c biogenesis protein CcmG, thiol:disulfide interchange protein DsbE
MSAHVPADGATDPAAHPSSDVAHIGVAPPATSATAASSPRTWLRSWKLWTALGVLAALVGLFVYGFTTDPKYVASPLIGKMAPPFAIARIGGRLPPEQLSLADLKGTPVILNFWASWCVACRDEASVLEAAYLKYDQGEHRARVVGIAIQDTPDQALAFAQHFGKTYFLGLDDARGDISLSYGLYGVPETFFIDATGRIAHKEIGAVTPEVIAQQVAALTGAKGTP